jgi:hypothetical protein
MFYFRNKILYSAAMDSIQNSAMLKNLMGECTDKTIKQSERAMTDTNMRDMFDNYVRKNKDIIKNFDSKCGKSQLLMHQPMQEDENNNFARRRNEIIESEGQGIAMKSHDLAVINKFMTIVV